jgi:hypothetical protein
MDRKLTAILVAICIVCLQVCALQVKVNDEETEIGQILNLFREDLILGKIKFSLEKEPHAIGAQISLDGGRNWKDMEIEDDEFIFNYRPISMEEELIPVFLITYEDGGMRSYNPYIKVVYQRRHPQEAINILLDKMKAYYEAENKNRFMSLFSYRFPNRMKFEEAIQNDFYRYRNIRLFYKVDRAVFDSDYKGAIWDVEWRRKYEDREGDRYEDSAVITMRFEKEGANWKITGWRNNTIFGSSLLLALPDLSISSSDIVASSTFGEIDYTVHNIGDGSAENIKVKLYYRTLPDGSWVGPYTDTISSISAGSSVTRTSNFGITTTGYYEFKVIIDPDNEISEKDETNNEATKDIRFAVYITP